MDQITYSGIKTMNKAEFAKSFKKAAIWRKTKGVIFFAKYKLSNGKMNLVAVPFKKYNEAAQCFKKEVKTDKENPYKAKLTMLAKFNLTKNEDGNLSAEVKPMKGSMSEDYLESYGKELFSKLKLDFNVLGDQSLDVEDLKEVAIESDEDFNKNEAAEEVQKQKKRAENIAKMLKNLPIIEGAVGQADTAKLEENLAKYKTSLEQIKKDALSDGKEDEEEKESIRRVSAYIEKISAQIKDLKNDDDSIHSDALIDNLENGENQDSKLEKDAGSLEKLEKEKAALTEKNLKNLNKIETVLIKLKDRILKGKIDPDKAIDALTKLEGSASKGWSFDQEDSTEEVLVIRDKLLEDIGELKVYVDQKLQKNETMMEELKSIMKESKKDAKTLIIEMENSLKNEMLVKFDNYATKLNEFYQN